MKTKMLIISGVFYLTLVACGGSSETEKQEVQKQTEQEMDDMMDEMNQSMSGDTLVSDSAHSAEEGHEGHTH